MNNNFSSGFTLIELLVISAIFAIIVILCVPHFNAIMAKAETKRITTTLQTIVRDSKYRAYVHRQRVAICGSNDGISCNGQEWSSGLLIFHDSTPNRRRDNDEKILNFIPLNLKHGDLQWRGFGISGNIVFQPDTGLPRGSNGSFFYCSNYAEHHKRIFLSNMGHTRVEIISTC